MNKSLALHSAEKYIQKKELSAAIHTYIEILKENPGDMLTMNALGDLYVRVGNIPQAIRNFLKIADYYQAKGFVPKALAMLKKIVKLDPNHVQAELRLADLYAGQRSLKEAFARYMRIATHLDKKGSWREATEVYQKVVAMEPANTAVHQILGERFAARGMRVKAVRAYLKAGEEFLRKNETEQALVVSLKVFEIDPENLQVLERINAIYRKKGQPEWGIKVIRQALETNPANPDILMLLARAFFHSGSFDEAEQTLRAFLQSDSSRYDEVLEFGKGFLRIGDLDRAVGCFDHCLEEVLARQEEGKVIELLHQVMSADSRHKGASECLEKIYNRMGMPFLLTLHPGELGGANAGYEAEGLRKNGSRLPTSRTPSRRESPPVADIIEIDLSAAFSNDMTMIEMNGYPLVKASEGPVAGPVQGSPSMAYWFRPVDDAIAPGKVDQPIAHIEPDSARVDEASQLILNAFSHLLTKLYADGQQAPPAAQTMIPEPSGFIPDIARPAESQPPAKPKKKKASRAQHPEIGKGKNATGVKHLRLKNRRRVDRYEWRLPVRVISQNDDWQECTESLDISPLGIKLKLQRPAQRGMVLRIEMLMPQPFRLQKLDEKRFEAVSLVCYVEQSEEKNIVGVEFGAIL